MSINGYLPMPLQDLESTSKTSFSGSSMDYEMSSTPYVTRGEGGCKFLMDGVR